MKISRYLGLVRKYVSLADRVPRPVTQAGRVCPECGYSTTRIVTLRRHIERAHSDMVDGEAVGRWNRQIFWRSKRGQRRISQAALEAILTQFHLRGRLRDSVRALVLTLFKLVLVRVACDED